MNSLRAIGIAECAEITGADAAFYAAWRHLIDTGRAWTREGFFGRTAPALYGRRRSLNGAAHTTLQGPGADKSATLNNEPAGGAITVTARQCLPDAASLS